ncbi:4'-phosphopantetheinyl transferase superfamily protein [Streptomyces sp. BR123]|uniref:4'-phosphopantetheinyl transferase family protein n=1 Tax=Streptomyces sp. BR123 TaxID=2749828 RepID=UPI0015C4E177|nr:4'-phosphopantetheinyl transferase superfamily protein [Streptomyces sp. BR123]NXY94245.1 4'-phosphopantetheinyl transferase superfamily protein [Streptomyces sp. BR123]
MNVIEIVPQVWAVSGRVTAPSEGHPDDLAAAAGMAGWRAEEFLAGRALLRRLLAEVAPGSENLRVTPGPHGKPGLPDRPDLAISIAHDEGHFAACAGVGRAVGIDVQQPGEHLAPGVVRRCVPTEHEAVNALPADERSREFAWIWTAQEACVKAEGSGLAGGPWTVPVGPGQTSGTWKGFTWRSLRDTSDTPLSCAWEAL